MFKFKREERRTSVAATPTVQYRNESYPLTPEKTVLDTLLDANIDISHGCKAGLCQACMLQCVEGEVPDKAVQGLNTSQKLMGYFLACQCIPDQSLSVSDINDESLRVPVRIEDIMPFNEGVTRLRLSGLSEFRGGQYVTLWPTEGLGRSYSIASIPSEGLLELHIKHLPGGAFSDWLRTEASVGDYLDLQGPIGLCFYNADISQRLLLAGIGTGLAPLLGVIKDALEQGHQGQIDLVLGAKAASSFYFVKQLLELENSFSNVHVHLVSQEESTEPFVQQADIYQYATSQLGSLAGSKVYICGADSFVRKMKRAAFLGGANMQDILSDAFLPSST